MSLKLKNNAQGRLAQAVNAADAEILLAQGDGTKFPTLAAGDWFRAALADDSGRIEFIKVTGRDGDRLFVLRGEEESATQDFAAGDYMQLRMTAGTWLDMVESARGPQGEAGPQGEKGEKGEPGEVGAEQIESILQSAKNYTDTAIAENFGAISAVLNLINGEVV